MKQSKDIVSQASSLHQNPLNDRFMDEALQAFTQFHKNDYQDRNLVLSQKNIINSNRSLKNKDVKSKQKTAFDYQQQQDKSTSRNLPSQIENFYNQNQKFSQPSAIKVIYTSRSSIIKEKNQEIKQKENTKYINMDITEKSELQDSSEITLNKKDETTFGAAGRPSLEEYIGTNENNFLLQSSLEKNDYQRNAIMIVTQEQGGTFNLVVDKFNHQNENKLNKRDNMLYKTFTESGEQSNMGTFGGKLSENEGNDNQNYKVSQLSRFEQAAIYMPNTSINQQFTKNLNFNNTLKNSAEFVNTLTSKDEIDFQQIKQKSKTNIISHHLSKKLNIDMLKNDKKIKSLIDSVIKKKQVNLNKNITLKAQIPSDEFKSTNKKQSAGGLKIFRAVSPMQNHNMNDKSSKYFNIYNRFRLGSLQNMTTMNINEQNGEFNPQNESQFDVTFQDIKNSQNNDNRHKKMRTLSIDTHNSLVRNDLQNNESEEKENPLNDSNIRINYDKINYEIQTQNNRRIINKNISNINTMNKGGENLNSPQCDSPITPFTPIQPKILFDSINANSKMQKSINNKSKNQIISRISISQFPKEDTKLKIDDILKQMNIGQQKYIINQKIDQMGIDSSKIRQNEKNMSSLNSVQSQSVLLTQEIDEIVKQKQLLNNNTNTQMSNNQEFTKQEQYMLIQRLNNSDLNAKDQIININLPNDNYINSEKKRQHEINTLSNRIVNIQKSKSYRSTQNDAQKMNEQQQSKSQNKFYRTIVNYNHLMNNSLPMNSNALSVNSGSNSLESNQLLSIADQEAIKFFKSQNQKKNKSIQQKIDQYFNKLQEYQAGFQELDKNGQSEIERKINEELERKYGMQNKRMDFKPAQWEEVVQQESELIKKRNQRFNSTNFENKDFLKTQEKIKSNQTEANIFNDKRIQLQSQKQCRAKSKPTIQIQSQLSSSQNIMEHQQNKNIQKSQNHLSLWKGLNEKNWLNIKMKLKCPVSGKKNKPLQKDEQINIQPIKNDYQLLSTIQNDINLDGNKNNQNIQSTFIQKQNQFKQRQNSCNLTVQFQKRRRALMTLKNIKQINQNNQQTLDNFDTQIDILSEEDNADGTDKKEHHSKYNSRAYFTTKSSIVTKSNVYIQNQKKAKYDLTLTNQYSRNDKNYTQKSELNGQLQIQNLANMKKQIKNGKSYGILQQGIRNNTLQKIQQNLNQKKISTPIATDFSIDIIKSLNDENQDQQQENKKKLTCDNVFDNPQETQNIINFGILEHENKNYSNNDTWYQNDKLIEIQMKNPLIQLKKIESKNDNIFTIQENLESQNHQSLYENERAATTQMFDNNIFKQELIKKKKVKRIKSSNQQALSHFLQERMIRNLKANRVTDKSKIDSLQIQGSKKEVKYHPAIQTVIDKFQNQFINTQQQKQINNVNPSLIKKQKDELRVSSQCSKSPIHNNINLKFKTNEIKTELIQSPAESSCTKSYQINNNLNNIDNPYEQQYRE